MPILNSIDTLIVKRRLLAIGYDAVSARKLFGELTGMASPIVNFPVVFSQAVCMSLVPVITDAFKKGDNEFVRQNAATSFKYAASIMFPCAGGMIVLSEPIMRLLYPTQQSSIESAARCLIVYAVGMIFLGLTHAMTGVLQGIGKQIIPVQNLFVGAIVKIVVTYVFTGIESINVLGAAIGTASAYFVACMLNILAVRKNTQFEIDIKSGVIKPLVSAALMSVFALLVYKVLYAALGNAVSCLLAVVAGAVIYAVLIVLTGVISISELKKVIKKR